MAWMVAVAEVTARARASQPGPPRGARVSAATRAKPLRMSAGRIQAVAVGMRRAVKVAMVATTATARAVEGDLGGGGVEAVGEGGAGGGEEHGGGFAEPGLGEGCGGEGGGEGGEGEAGGEGGAGGGAFDVGGVGEGDGGVGESGDGQGGPADDPVAAEVGVAGGQGQAEGEGAGGEGGGGGGAVELPVLPGAHRGPRPAGGHDPDALQQPSGRAVRQPGGGDGGPRRGGGEGEGQRTPSGDGGTHEHETGSADGPGRGPCRGPATGGDDQGQGAGAAPRGRDPAVGDGGDQPDDRHPVGDRRRRFVPGDEPSGAARRCPPVLGPKRPASSATTRSAATSGRKRPRELERLPRRQRGVGHGGERPAPAR